MSDTSDHTPAFWDAEAAEFDTAPDHGLSDPTVRTAWHALLTTVIPNPPRRVVDLGCGTGSLSVLLAADGHEVTGVDFSTHMIDAARDKASTLGVAATVQVGDAADPPVMPGEFDVVLVRHLLWAMPDPRAALTRWIELLDDGGTLVLIEGSWWTGAGMDLETAHALVRERRASSTVTKLTDPDLWGGPITDERYMIVSSA